MTIKHTTSGEALMEMQARIDRLRVEIATMHCGTAESIAGWLLANRPGIAADVAICIVRRLAASRMRKAAEVITSGDDFLVEN
jgi:hypothetical protein